MVPLVWSPSCLLPSLFCWHAIHSTTTRICITSYLELATIVLDEVLKELLGIVPPHDVDGSGLDVQNPLPGQHKGSLLGSKDKIGHIHKLTQSLQCKPTVSARWP